MKSNLIKLILFFTVFIIASFSVEAAGNCVVPIDGMNITTNTKFCYGEYYIPNGIHIKSNNVAIDCGNSKIIGNDTLWISYGKAGIDAVNKNNIFIKNCILKNYASGLYLGQTSNSNFRNIVANNNGMGILLSRSSNNILKDIDSISNRQEGIVFQGIHNSQLLNCRSEYSNFGTGHGRGLYLSESNNNLIRNCSFTNNDDFNIVIMRASSNNIIENSILKFSPIGIGTQSMPIYGNSINNSIRNNIFKNIINMDLTYFKNNTIISNTFYLGAILGDIGNNTFCVRGIGNIYRDGATGPKCRRNKR